MDREVIPERRHAQSPISLISVGRGSVKKPHPHEIRIPDCLCTFSETVGQVINESCNGSKDVRPSRGRGRGTASFACPPTRTYSSREKLIARTLDAQKMDEKDGKGFIMKKFLGQQMNPFLDAYTDNSFSQSSGHSRKSCPATLPASHKNRTEWPALSKEQSGPSSLHNQKEGRKTKASKNGMTSKNKAGALTADSNCQLKEFSASEDQIIAKESKSLRNASAGGEKFQGGTEVAENLCGELETVEKSNLNNNHSDKENEKENEDSDKDKEFETKADMEDTSVMKEPVFDSLPEPSLEGVKSSSDTGGEISLKDVAKQISNINEEEKDDTAERLEEATETEVKESGGVEEDVNTGTEEELNYKLFVRHEEFQPGDVSPLTGPNVLQIEGLPSVINDEDVSDLFFSCGTVTACKVLRDADSKLCIGIAYIRLEESAACAMAVSSFDSEPSPFADIDGDEEVPILKVRHFLPSD